MDFSRQYDLLIIGGGNAALCAAITARGLGLDVLVVESAPIHFRGGNSRHTRNMRTMHDGPLDVLTGAYPEEEYWQDLLKVTGGLTDETLARLTIRQTGASRALDETARRAFSAAARRHAAAGAHERILPGRRQGAPQRLLRRGRAARRRRRV